MSSHAALTPVPFTAVSLAPGLLQDFQTLNRTSTIPAEYHQCQTTGRTAAWSWTPASTGPAPHIFFDSDIAKWIEAASYSLATHPDPALDAQVDAVIATIVSAQAPDGYLNSYFLRVKPEGRWTNLRDNHELYSAGHFIEAAVAHFHSTGKRSLLDPILRYVAHIDATFGTAPGKKRGYCGHEEIELALFRLHALTGDPQHRALATYFLEERGRTPYYFDVEAAARHDTAKYWAAPDYFQAHLPIRQQTTAEGHAVRAVYLYSAMTDLAAATGDPALAATLETLWTNVTARRLYVTGGIGSSAQGERFTTDFDLPNAAAYAETCAAIGLIFWAHRMHLLTGQARFIDTLERALYNAALPGLALTGTSFFYVNPLASAGSHHRQPWFGCACCPPNIARLLASLGNYFYATAPDMLIVNLYAASTSTVTLNNLPISITQKTNFPWDGSITLTLSPSAPVEFELRLRIPEWTANPTLTLNAAPLPFETQDGYARIRRRWLPGDTLGLALPMPIHRLEAHPAISDDAGRVALQRGPLVYCLESADNAGHLHNLILPRTAPITATHRPELLGGITTLDFTALQQVPASFPAATLYRPQHPSQFTPTPVRAIPYYAWDNRTPGPMQIWLRSD